MGEVNYAPLIDDMVWSYSRIKAFEDCPYRWYLKYIKKFHGKDMKQLIDFKGLELDNGIYPTDIDGLIEYHDSEYILLEVKHKDARVPYGQRLAIQRMVDDFTKAGKKAVAIVCEHKVDDTDKPVVAAFCKVRELYYGGEHKWRPPDSPMNVRQAIDKFRKYAKQHKGG